MVSIDYDDKYYDSADDRYYDAAMDAYYEELEQRVEEELKNISRENVKTYLATYGDAIDHRVMRCLKEADDLFRSGYLGPALTLAATAIEIIIRYFLLTPLLQGAFLSNEWAAILSRRIENSRSADDRDLLPAVLRKWELDLSKLKTSSGELVWVFVINTLWPSRNMFIHKGGLPDADIVAKAIECARLFRSQIVGALASKLEFTLEKTGKWSIVQRENESGGVSTSYSKVDSPFAERAK